VSVFGYSSYSLGGSAGAILAGEHYLFGVLFITGLAIMCENANKFAERVEAVEVVFYWKK
jgi:hypothetical protein